MLLHERFLRSEVDQRILNQLVQNHLDFGVALSRSQSLIKLVDSVKQFLVLLIEKGDIYAVGFRPAKRTSGDGHFSLPKKIFLT